MASVGVALQSGYDDKEMLTMTHCHYVQTKSPLLFCWNILKAAANSQRLRLLRNMDKTDNTRCM